MKKYSTLLVIRELKLQGNITSHQSEWLSSKNPQTINTGKDVEREEPS